MSSHSLPIDISPHLDDLYIRVARALRSIEPSAKGQDLFEDLYRALLRASDSGTRRDSRQWICEGLLPFFDPAPWKTQLNSLSALVTSIRIALLTQLLAGRRVAGFKAEAQAMPLQGFFETRVNKHNAP